MGVWNESLHKRDEIGRFARMDRSGEKKSEKSDKEAEPQTERKGPGVTLGTQTEVERTEGKLTPEERAEQRERDKQATQKGHCPIYDSNTYKREQGDTSIAGVKPGKEMTFEEADGGNCNPFFMQDKRNGGNLYGYTSNCVACVVAFEARMRGYDVIALPVNGNKKMTAVVGDFRLAFDMHSKSPGKQMHIIQNSHIDGTDTISFLGENVKNGNRYLFRYSTIYKDGKGNSIGHVVCAEKTSNGLRIYDPQSGLSYEGKDGVGKYAEFMKSICIPNTEVLMQINNLEFNYEYVDFIVIRAENG